MKYEIDTVDVAPLTTFHRGALLHKATVHGSCILSTSWQMVFHFTHEADILEDKAYPLFGCKNFDKKKHLQCVKMSSEHQGIPCPILTQHFGEIRHQLMVYLIEHGFVEQLAVRCNHNSLFNTALNTIEAARNS